MKPILVYITTQDEKQAEMIGISLVKKKLASCTNIIPEIHSQYIWKGSMHHEKEAVLIVKSFEEKFEELERLVNKKHTYEVPCIIAIPIIKGGKEYLQWSQKQCK